MACSNGKYKYGAKGQCVFDTLEACKRAAAAIHIQDKTDYDDVEHKQYVADVALTLSRLIKR